ncbi:UNKNOWN [Stylonychia lemnae]|uniref:DUF1704 domain containing protein n=1 Tax=Stylonychia lemnae TaxID=5949 RepID=A0A078B4R2_STYLE|nr:UNKNOWN [Stylonychia lemnae]|eukprot:CDW88508.1 UNKNOWN [Stylonychia lemnae]
MSVTQLNLISSNDIQKHTLSKTNSKNLFNQTCSNGQLVLPVQTDKMVSYQSFSPANLIRQDNKKMQMNTSMRDLTDKKAPHQVLKQKYLRQKYGQQRHQYDGRQVLNPVQIVNQEEYQELIKQELNSKKMIVAGFNQNITRTDNNQNAISPSRTLPSGRVEQIKYLQQNQLLDYIAHEMGVIEEPLIYLDKNNNNLLRSFEQSPKTLAGNNNPPPSLMICSISSYLKTQNNLNAQINDNLMLSPSQTNLSRDRNEVLNMMHVNDTENDIDSEDDQSECVSEKSHDVPEILDTNRTQDQQLKEIYDKYTYEPEENFFTSTKIDLKPKHDLVAIKNRLSKQPISNTPNQMKKQSLMQKLNINVGINTGRKTIQQFSTEATVVDKQEQIVKLQQKKKDFLQSNQQQQQISFKKKKRKFALGNILCTLPKNLREQEAQFFLSNFQVNPVFTYDNIYLTQRYVNDFTFVENEELLNIAVKIIKAFISEYGSERNFIEREGRLLTREETEESFQNYIAELELEEYLALNFTSNAIAPTSITHSNNGKKSKINICLPIDYSEGRIQGVMHHEIGTHFVRKFNDKFQMWTGKRAVFNLQGSLDTEEGLACINQQLENTIYGKNKLTNRLKLKPYLFRPALYYYCCHQIHLRSSQKVHLSINLNSLFRWKYVMRVKRGLINTQDIGGFYKDQVYLRGAVEILKYRRTINFEDLFCGKLALQDVLLISSEIKKIKLNKETSTIKLPTFLKDMELYKKAIDEIARVNFID